jgi:hypothetical protein
LIQKQHEAQGEEDADETNTKNKIIVIKEAVISQLCKFRKQFGTPSFFKLFRAFYKLCNITTETQNNPFELFMDRKSCLRGFKEVFGIDIEEVALRFFRLFTLSDKEVIFKTTDHIPHSEDAIKF